MITRKRYNQIKDKLKRYESAQEELFPGKCSFSPKDIKTVCKCAHLRQAPTNAERSSVEVFAFFHNKPKKYFAYVEYHKREKWASYTAKITTWTGDILGVAMIDRAYTSNMGDSRRRIRVKAINGESYYGIYFDSAGDYCKLTKYKNAQSFN